MIARGVTNLTRADEILAMFNIAKEGGDWIQTDRNTYQRPS